MLITFCGNVLICDSDAAMVLFSQRGASGGLFGMVYEVSSARIGIASSPSSSRPFGVCVGSVYGKYLASPLRPSPRSGLHVSR